MEQTTLKSGDLKREAILASALKLFAIKGYGTTSIDEIAKDAKVSHGLVYHYFKNKEEILEIILETAKEAIEKFGQPQGKDETSLQAFRRITDGFLKALENDDETFYFGHLFLTIYRFKSFSKTNTQNYIEQYIVRLLEDIFASLIEKGYMGGETKLTTIVLCYFTLLRGLFFTIIRSEDREMMRSRLPSTDYILSLFLKGGVNYV